jgi:hypothetical protein
LPIFVTTARSNRRRYLAACRDPQVWRRTLALGLPVGLMQAALNQGDHWWQHHVDATVVAKTVLSPLLSCSIAFVSAISTQAARRPETSSL